MKFQRLLVIAAIGLMSIFLLSGSAHAQLQEIIDDYCREIEQNVNNTRFELGEASNDLEECTVDLDDCLSGLFQRDPVKCIDDYSQCTTFGQNDQMQACNEFRNEFRQDTKRAERRADRRDVEDEFLAWLYGDSDQRNTCLAPALATALVCADLLTSD